MSEQAEAAPTQQTDGPADEAGIELGKTTPEVVEPQPEPQPEQTETATPQDAGSQGEEKAGAPESYDFVAPEGVAVGEEAIAAYSELAKSLDLPQDQAQEGFDKLAKAQAGAMQAAFQKQVAAWTEETRKDAEVGGENFQASTVKADQSLAAFDTNEREFTALLNETGLAAHPATRRFLLRVRDAISDDRFVAGTAGEQAGASAKSHFPNSPDLKE